MSDTSKPSGDPPQTAAVPGVLAPTTGGIPPLATESGDALHLVEERLRIAKRRLSTGSVRVGTRTATVEAVAAAELDRYRVEVTRVPVGRVVDEVPAARAEGDTTIIPVVEERLVVVKQLVLVEEIHVRHVLERETVSEPVTLRRQRAVVERRNAEGQSVGEDQAAPVAPDLSDRGAVAGPMGDARDGGRATSPGTFMPGGA